MSVKTTAASTSHRAVDIRRFPWIRRLAADYAFNFDALAPFYAGNPHDDQAWRDAIRRTSSHPRDRGRVADILLAQPRRGCAIDRRSPS